MRALSVLQARKVHRKTDFVQSLDHPELIVTWGSEFPDKLKLRKQVTLWPLRFKLRADYNRTVRNFEYGCSCKVSMTLPTHLCSKAHLLVQCIRARSEAPLYICVV